MEKLLEQGCFTRTDGVKVAEIVEESAGNIEADVHHKVKSSPKSQKSDDSSILTPDNTKVVGYVLPPLLLLKKHW